MCSKIKKLLTSPILEDVMIGWELLKTKEIPHNDTRWYEYFDCFTINPIQYGEINEFSCKCISDICPNHTINSFWLEWCKHNNRIKTKIKKLEIQNIHNK